MIETTWNEYATLKPRPNPILTNSQVLNSLQLYYKFVVFSHPLAKWPT